MLLALGLLTVLVAGVGLRVKYAVDHPDELKGDAVIYDRMARQPSEGGYPGYGPDRLRSWRPPLYPTFAAGVYRLLGPRPLHVKLVQAGASGLLILLVFLIGRRLLSDAAGIAGALFFAFVGYEIRHSAALYPETLLALLLTAFAYLGLREPSFRRMLAQGLLAGLVLHVQPGLASLVAFWTVWLLLREWGLKSLGLAAVFATTTALCLVPWTARNHRIHGEFVYVSTNGGFNLLKGNNPEATAMPAPPTYVDAVKSEKPSELDEIESDRWYRRRAVSWIIDHPGAYLVLALARFVRWIVPGHIIEPGSGWPMTYGVLFPFAVLGAALLFRKREPIGRLLVYVAAIATPSVLVVFAGPRYRTPAMPVLAAIAGVGLAALIRLGVDWLARRRARVRAPDQNGS